MKPKLLDEVIPPHEGKETTHDGGGSGTTEGSGTVWGSDAVEGSGTTGSSSTAGGSDAVKGSDTTGGSGTLGHTCGARWFQQE